jgi:hypothetical protein
MPKARPRAIKYYHVITSVNGAGFRVTHEICIQGLGQGYGAAWRSIFYIYDRIPQL